MRLKRELNLACAYPTDTPSKSSAIPIFLKLASPPHDYPVFSDAVFTETFRLPAFLETATQSSHPQSRGIPEIPAHCTRDWQHISSSTTTTHCSRVPPREPIMAGMSSKRLQKELAKVRNHHISKLSKWNVRI